MSARDWPETALEMRGLVAETPRQSAILRCGGRNWDRNWDHAGLITRRGIRLPTDFDLFQQGGRPLSAKCGPVSATADVSTDDPASREIKPLTLSVLASFESR